MEHRSFEGEDRFGRDGVGADGHDPMEAHGRDDHHGLHGDVGDSVEARTEASTALLPEASPQDRTWDQLTGADDQWNRPATEGATPTTWDAPPAPAQDAPVDEAGSPQDARPSSESASVPNASVPSASVPSASVPNMSVEATGERMPSLDELLSKLIELKGSDLHLKVGSPPAYRLDGELHFAELRTLTPADTVEFANQVMPDHVSERFEAEREADFAYGKAALGRFRVNVYRQRGSISIVLRSVPPVTSTFDELGLPQVMGRLAKADRGLIIVTGRAGTGKTTTVGAILDHINSNRRCNIITLEDPIEILHTDKLSIVSQREIGLDTASYRDGIDRALRQDADVIYMGEMRTAETMEAAMHAAESGKLVITTMLTADASETVTRIIDTFPPFHQKQARYTLASVLKGVLCHRLLPRADGNGRAVAVESLTINERTYERIVDPDLTHLLLDAIVDGSFYGMQSFDQALITLYQKKIVTFQDAMAHATDPSDFKLAAQAMGLSTS